MRGKLLPLFRRPLFLYAFMGVFFVSVVVSVVMAGCGKDAITKDRLIDTIEGMEEMIELTSTGDVDAGEQAFNRVHPFFHELDRPLRQRDRELGDELWKNVLRIEFEYARLRNADVLVREAEKNVMLLKRVSRAFEWGDVE